MIDPATMVVMVSLLRMANIGTAERLDELIRWMEGITKLVATTERIEPGELAEKVSSLVVCELAPYLNDLSQRIELDKRGR